MPHSDSDTGADVTARALARVNQARKRAIWADDFVTLNADRRGRTRMEMREIRADLATDSARAELASLVADVPLLAAIAAAAVRLAMREGCTVLPSPWWANERRDHWYSCKVCYNEGQTIDQIQHDDDCPALELDAAIRAAGEAGHV